MFPACRPAGAPQTIEALRDFVQRATGQSLIGVVTDLLSLTLIGGGQPSRYRLLSGQHREPLRPRSRQGPF